MKQSLKLFLIVLTLALLALCLGVTAGAVPPAPGSGWQAGHTCPSHAGETYITLSDLSGTRPGGAMAAPSLEPAKRDIPLVMIVIGFRDLPYEPTFNWADTIFSGPKSLRQYYTDMSYGQFTFDPAQETCAFGVNGNRNAADKAGDGVIHVTLDRLHEDWTLDYRNADEELRRSRSLLSAFSEAIVKAGEYIDFQAYDRDGDGVIARTELALGFVVAGYEASYDEECPLGRSKYLWAHAWNIPQAFEELGINDMSAPVVDGVQVADYIAIAEHVTKDTQEPISVLAHELGHYLGLPDLYDTEYNAYGAWAAYDVGLLSVMCAGSWGVDPDGGPDACVPYSFDMWSRYVLGWVTPRQGTQNGEYTLSATDRNQAALLIPTSNPSEYYLLENRSFIGWDAGMASDYPDSRGGVILWHIDDSVYDAYAEMNAVNNSDHRPAVMPLFPEQKTKLFGRVETAYTGNTRAVLLTEPFHSYSMWQSVAASDLGESLNLPLYGSGILANNRGSRKSSGIRITFTSNARETMRLWIGPGVHKHDMRHVLETPATCVSSGTAEYWACESCGRIFLDVNGADETTMAALVLPQNGNHSLVLEGEPVAATCTEGGYEVYVCTLCGEHRLLNETPPAGHTPGEPQKENETETGYELVVVCAVCGQELSRKLVLGEDAEPFLPGDVDDDGKVTAADARLALRAAVGLETYAPGSRAFLAADVDFDGLLTAGDARAILRAAVGLELLKWR